jgi:predicted HTH domain antitoxin
MVMQVSPLKEIARDLPFFKTLDDREKLLGVVGALVLRRISLSKASEIMGMERERFLGLLDAMRLEYSYLEDQDIDVERKWKEPRS